MPPDYLVSAELRQHLRARRLHARVGRGTTEEQRHLRSLPLLRARHGKNTHNPSQTRSRSSSDRKRVRTSTKQQRYAGELAFAAIHYVPAVHHQSSASIVAVASDEEGCVARYLQKL